MYCTETATHRKAANQVSLTRLYVLKCMPHKCAPAHAGFSNTGIETLVTYNKTNVTSFYPKFRVAILVAHIFKSI